MVEMVPLYLSCLKALACIIEGRENLDIRAEGLPEIHRQETHFQEKIFSEYQMDLTYLPASELTPLNKAIVSIISVVSTI